MSKTSPLIQLSNDRFITIRESHLAICGSNCAAALLNYYANRLSALIDKAENDKSNKKGHSIKDSDLLIMSSNDYIQNGLLGVYGRNSIIKANQDLMALGYISIVADIPNPNGRFPINHILLNTKAVNLALKAYESKCLELNACPNPSVYFQTLTCLDLNAYVFKSKRIKEEYKKEEKKKENILTPAKVENQLASTVDAKKETPTALNAIFEKEKATSNGGLLVQTNKYRLIETPEELTDVTEQVIIEYAPSLKKDFERRGFIAANARDYAIEFANQFFKSFQMCSLQDAAIKRKLAEWAYIFAKVNTEIAQAQKAVNMTMPYSQKIQGQAVPTKKNTNLLSMLD